MKNFVDIPQDAREWPLEETPIPPRLRNCLRRHGVKTLNDLHGRTFKSLLRIKGCGAGSASDLRVFLSRLHTGEFDRLLSAGSTDAPSEVVKLIDDFCRALNPRTRDIFVTRMGGHRDPLTLAEIGHKYRLTRERVRQIVNLRIEELRRHGGPPCSRLLRHLMTRCEEKVFPLVPELLASWLETQGLSYRYSPGFYVRVIKEWLPEFPAWPEGRGNGWPNPVQKGIAIEIKRQLGKTPQVIPTNVLYQQLREGSGFAELKVAEFLEVIRMDESFLLTHAGPEQLMVHTPMPGPVECAKNILAESDHPLTSRAIIEEARRIWGEKVAAIAAYRLSRLLLAEKDVFPFDLHRFGLRKHIRLPQVLWSKIQNDVYELMQRDDSSISTFVLVEAQRFDWTRQTTGYELAAILRLDSRFIALDRHVFAVAMTMPRAGSMATQTTLLNDPHQSRGDFSL